MFKGAFVFVCGVAAGALIYETALERATVKMRPASGVEWRTPEQQHVLTSPLQPDATVQLCRTSLDCDAEKRYYSGMRR